MAVENKFDVLFEILSNEQQILQRTDQKACTLLSLIGVFSTFFIVHYTKIPADFYNLILVFLYFVSALFAIYSLLLVILPRIRDSEEIIEENKKTFLPTFFGGIVRYKSSKDYFANLKSLMEDLDNTYEMFTKSIYSVGRINSYKNKYFRKGIVAFVITVSIELVIIISIYTRMII